MIHVRNLRFAYPPVLPTLPVVDVLQDVTLDLAAGEALALWGATGSGKSTLGLLLAGLAPHLTGGTCSRGGSAGERVFPGHPGSAVSRPCRATFHLFGGR